jgi:phage tail-like protein
MPTPTGQRDDPYGQYNFLVEIDGVTRAGFTECSGLDADVQKIDYREGADIQQNVRKLRGLVNFTDIMLKRGYTQDKELYNWYRDIVNGNIDRRSCEIALFNEARNEVLRWRVVEAWIGTWKGPAFNATANEIAIEEVSLCHEGLELL